YFPENCLKKVALTGSEAIAGGSTGDLLAVHEPVVELVAGVGHGRQDNLAPLLIEAGSSDPASLCGNGPGGYLEIRLKPGGKPAISGSRKAIFRIGANLFPVLVPSLKGVVRCRQGFQNNFGALLIGACAPNRAAIPGLGTGLYPDAGNEMSRKLEV